jgi:hypothetical protein
VVSLKRRFMSVERIFSIEERGSRSQADSGSACESYQVRSERMGECIQDYSEIERFRSKTSPKVPDTKGAPLQESFIKDYDFIQVWRILCDGFGIASHADREVGTGKRPAKGSDDR